MKIQLLCALIRFYKNGLSFQNFWCYKDMISQLIKHNISNTIKFSFLGGFDGKRFRNVERNRHLFSNLNENRLTFVLTIGNFNGFQNCTLVPFPVSSSGGGVNLQLLQETCLLRQGCYSWAILYFYIAPKGKGKRPMILDPSILVEKQRSAHYSSSYWPWNLVHRIRGCLEAVHPPQPDRYLPLRALGSDELKQKK